MTIDRRRFSLSLGLTFAACGLGVPGSASAQGRLKGEITGGNLQPIPIARRKVKRGRPIATAGPQEG